MIATALVSCLSILPWPDPGQEPSPVSARILGEGEGAAAELAPWPLSERALLGAVLVGDGERRLATVRDALIDGLTGEVLYLAVELRAADGSVVSLSRREVRWHFEHQRFATHLGAAELARRPVAPSALGSTLLVAHAPRGTALEAATHLDVWSSSARSLPAQRAWSLAALRETSLAVGGKAQRVTGLVLDADARRVLALVISRGERELALPPSALGLGSDGRLFLREGSRASRAAPSAPGPVLDALADPEFRALWEAHWTIPEAASGS